MFFRESINQRFYNMNKKTVLITGGNAGIGFATARVLAKEGAQVLLACRNQDKAIAAANSFDKKHRMLL